MDNWSLRKEVEDINYSRSTVILRPNKETAAKIVGRLEPYKNIPEMFRPALEQTAHYIRGTVIPRIFDREGPGWRPLAPRTVAERIAAGYPGQHPILYRTGDLFKSLTQRSHPEHIEVIKVGKNSRIELGSSSKKFVENQRGNPASRLPARPMLPGTGSNAFTQGDRIAIKRIFEGVKHRRHDRL